MQTLNITKKYEKYPEYKDSGVPWLGKIPKDWEIANSRRIFNTEKERVGSSFANYKILSLTLNGIIPKVLDGSGKNPAEYDTYQIVKKNDLIFCLFDYDVTPRTIGYVEENGMLTGAYTRLMPKEETFSKYYYYYFLSLDYTKELLHLCTGLRSSISKPLFWSIKNPLPDIKIQNKIANYLDEKTQLVDQIIEKKEKLIELLKEKRTAVINNAVTKGLDKNVELVDSGVEWIGEIPKGWGMKRLKYLAEIIPSNVDKLTVENEKIIRLCNYVDVYKNEIIEKSMIDNLMIATATQKQIDKLSLLSDDVIITKDSETPEDIGVSAYVPKKLDGVVCGYHLSIIRPQNISGKFLFNYLKSDSSKIHFFLFANGLTRYALGIDDISNLKVLVPNKEEQDSISNFMTDENNAFDLSFKKIQDSIELLKEFKSSLISNVVTGKIKV